MDEPTYALRPPPAALRDPESWELLRAWVAEGGLHCMLNIGVYEHETPMAEDTVWGIVLADVARHVADALAAEGLRDRETALAEVKRSFIAEMENPTSDSRRAD